MIPGLGNVGATVAATVKDAERQNGLRVLAIGAGLLLVLWLVSRRA